MKSAVGTEIMLTRIIKIKYVKSHVRKTFSVKSMERELNKALHKGLPYPILKVIEYLSVDRAGFIWGRQYRLAGYYASILLWYVQYFSLLLFCLNFI